MKSNLSLSVDRNSACDHVLFCGRLYALDPNDAEALWKKSEDMVGESF
jgi:hypothetical protein